MKKLLFFILLITSYNVVAQNNSELKKHFETYYNQMKKQGDVQGIINGLTHLNILAPSQARKDTLAYIYMNGNKYNQALNVIGVEANPNDSNLAVEVKAVSLQSLNQPELAIPHFQEMFKREPSPFIAYELAELNLQIKNIAAANQHINYGMQNSTDDLKKPYYETQQPYQVPLKAAFTYLKGLATFNENTSQNIDAAIALFNEALQLAPNFNLAQISKEALEAQKK